MCGMWTEAQIVKFWKASETSPHDWFFILKNIQLIQVNHLIYKRRRCFGSLYCNRWKKDENVSTKKKRNPINMKIFFNSLEIVFLRSIAQKIKKTFFIKYVSLRTFMIKYLFVSGREDGSDSTQPEQTSKLRI